MMKNLRTAIGLLICAVVIVCAIVGLSLSSSGNVAFAGPDQCRKNCQNQHCMRGECPDAQHQKRLDECLKKCP